MPEAADRCDPALGRAALAVSALAGFLTPFMGSAVNVALPAIAAEFGMSAVSLGWVATAYILTAAMFLVPFGRIADIRGRKKIFAWGLGIFTVASLLCAASFSSASLIIFRALQGLGGALIFGTGVAILTCVFPPGERGRVLGINTAAVYLGLSLGPVLGGFLTARFGWRSIFLANVPIGLAALVLLFRNLKGEWADAKNEAFDIVGSVLFSAGLVALMFGFARLPTRTGAVLTVLGAVSIVVFVAWERKAPAPVLDVRLFRDNRVFAFSNLAALINYSATSAVAFLLSLYLQYIKGLSPGQAGLVLVAQPAVMVLISPLAGKLSDRIDPRLLASMGMAVSTAGLALLLFLDGGASFAFIAVCLFCLGAGFGLFSSPNTNAVMGSVEKRLYGVAAAALGTMRLTGQMLSLGILMMIFAAVMGRARIEPGNFPLFLRSLRAAFIVFSLLCAAGIFASLARGRKQG